MNNAFLSRNTYIFLFSLLGLVYIIGLFVPLMDTDAAHHADIALRMYLTGDYINLTGHPGAYLDKPHLHFWLSAFSYQLFGVTTFAYKLPSFLFSIGGVYATYRLGKFLYNTEVGKLASLLIATSFAFILANSDVRMDAILTACIAFSCWQLISFARYKKIIQAAGSALWLALGFCTKGHIAVFVPAVALLFYLLYTRDWKLLVNPKTFLLIFLFAIFVSPVVYCYYLQYNLHPETVARGKDHINGVKFILLNQSIERFSGGMGSDGKADYFFFFHTFLWAFAPWSLLSCIALYWNGKDFLKRKTEWVTVGVFVVVGLIVSFSGFKLPHYLNIIFPTTAVLTAAFIISKKENGFWIRFILIIQAIFVLLLLLFSLLMNGWFFPVTKSLVLMGTIILLAIVFYFVKTKSYSTMQKNVLIPAAAMVFSFFLLNSNFYPRLLTYQGGNELAFATRGKVDPKNVHYFKGNFNSSFIFYSATDISAFNDSLLSGNNPVWLIIDQNLLNEIRNAGYKTGRIYSTPDFPVTRLNVKFLNPATRLSVSGELLLVEIISKPDEKDN